MYFCTSFRLVQFYYIFLSQTQCIHFTVSIHNRNNDKETLLNEIKKTQVGGDNPGVNLTLDVKQWDINTGGSLETNPPLREVPHNINNNRTKTQTDKIDAPANVMPISTLHPSIDPESILTRETNLNKKERVMRIIQEVTIRPDISDDQHQAVQELLEEYADCFALSIMEVNAIPGAVHKLNIPEGATFHMKIPPRSYNPDQ